MVILDTDILTLIQWGSSPEANRLAARLEKLPPEEIVTTIVNFEEQTRGWLKYAKDAKTVAAQIEAYRRLKQHLVTFCHMVVLDFDDRAAVEYQRLGKMKLRVKPMDLRIAAIALACDATVVTRNLSDFAKVPHLKVEDWTV